MLSTINIRYSEEYESHSLPNSALQKTYFNVPMSVLATQFSRAVNAEAFLVEPLPFEECPSRRSARATNPSSRRAGLRSGRRGTNPAYARLMISALSVRRPPMPMLLHTASLVILRMRHASAKRSRKTPKVCWHSFEMGRHAPVARSSQWSWPRFPHVAPRSISAEKKAASRGAALAIIDRSPPARPAENSFSSKEGKGIDTRPRVASNPLKNAPAIQRETSVSLMTAPVSAQRSSRNTGLCEVVRMHTAPRILISKESATPAHPSNTPQDRRSPWILSSNTINVIIAATTPYNPAKKANNPPAFLMGAHAILECFTIQLHIIAEERPPLSKNFN